MRVETWQITTCQHCKYRVGQDCRLMPPSLVKSDYAIQTLYPRVFIPEHTEYSHYLGTSKVSDFYENACSKYEVMR